MIIFVLIVHSSKTNTRRTCFRAIIFFFSLNTLASRFDSQEIRMTFMNRPVDRQKKEREREREREYKSRFVYLACGKLLPQSVRSKKLRSVRLVTKEEATTTIRIEGTRFAYASRTASAIFGRAEVLDYAEHVPILHQVRRRPGGSVVFVRF